MSDSRILTAECGNCGTRLRVKTHQAQKVVTCPKCKSQVTVSSNPGSTGGGDEVDAKVARLNKEKEAAVAQQDFEKAAQLRGLADRLTKGAPVTSDDPNEAISKANDWEYDRHGRRVPVGTNDRRFRLMAMGLGTAVLVAVVSLVVLVLFVEVVAKAVFLVLILLFVGGTYLVCHTSGRLVFGLGDRRRTLVTMGYSIGFCAIIFGLGLGIALLHGLLDEPSVDERSTSRAEQARWSGKTAVGEGWLRVAFKFPPTEQIIFDIKVELGEGEDRALSWSPPDGTKVRIEPDGSFSYTDDSENSIQGKVTGNAAVGTMTFRTLLTRQGVSPGPHVLRWSATRE